MERFEMVEIRMLAEEMFGGLVANPCLDRMTGAVVNAGKLPNPMDAERYLPLPRYSCAHLRQQFMREMHEKWIFSDADMAQVSHWPDFPLVQDETLATAEREYLSQAHRLCADLGMEDTAYDPPGRTRTQETYIDYEDRRSLELAQAWCREHGLRFYDARDIPLSEERQRRLEAFKREHLENWYKLPCARKLYDPETFARIMEEELRKMHAEWLQKREAYARAVASGEMPDVGEGF